MIRQTKRKYKTKSRKVRRSKKTKHYSRRSKKSLSRKTYRKISRKVLKGGENKKEEPEKFNRVRFVPESKIGVEYEQAQKSDNPDYAELPNIYNNVGDAGEQMRKRASERFGDYIRIKQEEKPTYELMHPSTNTGYLQINPEEEAYNTIPFKNQEQLETYANPNIYGTRRKATNALPPTPTERFLAEKALNENNSKFGFKGEIYSPPPSEDAGIYEEIPSRTSL